jgi:hypothetical protein
MIRVRCNAGGVAFAPSHIGHDIVCLMIHRTIDSYTITAKLGEVV